MARPPKNTDVEQLPQGFICQTVETLQILRSIGVGVPKTAEELKERCNEYFATCEKLEIRPGIETMCLAIGISRKTFWAWCSGSANKPDDFVEVCIRARQVCVAFLEISATCGKLNPVMSIFLLKNWANYRDSASIESESKNTEKQRTISIADLPKLEPLSNRNTSDADLPF